MTTIGPKVNVEGLVPTQRTEGRPSAPTEQQTPVSPQPQIATDDSVNTSNRVAHASNPTDVQFSAPTQQNELSPETRALMREVAGMPNLPPGIGLPSLLMISRKLMEKGFSDQDIRDMLQSIKDSGSDRAQIAGSIKEMAKAADHPFHNTLNSDARYDPSLTPRQVADINRDENKLVPIGNVWNRSVTTDAGVNIGSTNGEAQKPPTGGTTGGTTPPTTGTQISLGDIFNQKLLGMGIHFNYDNVRNSGGVSIPSWLNEQLQNASTQADAEKVMDKLIGYLSRAGVLPPATPPTQGTGGSNGNGG